MLINSSFSCIVELQDKDAVDVEEIALVALQLDMLAGLNMQDVRSMCDGAIGSDAQKLLCLCLAFMSTTVDGQVVTTSQAEDEKQTRVKKRKRGNLETDFIMAEAGPLFRHVSQVRIFLTEANTANYMKAARCKMCL